MEKYLLKDGDYVDFLPMDLDLDFLWEVYEQGAGKEYQNAAQNNSAGRAPQDARPLMPSRQVTAGKCYNDGVIPAENDVYRNDLEDRDDESIFNHKDRAPVLRMQTMRWV